MSESAFIEINADSGFKCNYVENRADFPKAILLFLITLKDGNMACGSGFMITADGYAVTNEHVVNGAVDILVKMSDNRFLPATVVCTDKENDLAVVKVKTQNCCFCELDDSGKAPELETPIRVFGYPRGTLLNDSVRDLNMSVVRGYVASNQTLDGYKRIMLDAELFHGNSGSPVINANTGRVIGVECGAFEDTANAVEITIPVEYVFSMVRKYLRATGKDAGAKKTSPPVSKGNGKKTPPQESDEYPFVKCLFATCMRYGFGCEKSPENARTLDMDAAEAGSIVSLYSLSGDVFQKNLPEKTIRLLSDYAQKGYDAGHIFAAHNYAGCFRFGLGRPKDEASGIKMMLSLCEPTPYSEKQQKITEEYVALAHLARAIPEAEKYFRDELNRYLNAMKNGNAFSLLNVGLCHMEGKGGLPRDAKRGYEYILRAAQQDHFYACLHTGFCCEHGIGVEKSEKNADAWYRKCSRIAAFNDIHPDIEAKKKEISYFYRSYI